jgi:hypothetical protein
MKNGGYHSSTAEKKAIVVVAHAGRSGRAGSSVREVDVRADARRR